MPGGRAAMRLVQWCGVPQQWHQSMWSLWCASEWEREGRALRFGATDLDRRHATQRPSPHLPKDHCELGSNLKPTMTVLKVQVVWRFASSFWYFWRVHRFTCRGHFSIIRKMYSLVKTMISQGGIQYVSFVECNRLLPLRVVHLIWFICQSSSWNSQNDPTMESYVSPLHFFEILMTTLVARTYAHNAHGWKEVIRRKQPKKRSLFWAPQRNVHPWNST